MPAPFKTPAPWGNRKQVPADKGAENMMVPTTPNTATDTTKSSKAARGVPKAKTPLQEAKGVTSLNYVALEKYDLNRNTYFLSILRHSQSLRPAFWRLRAARLETRFEMFESHCLTSFVIIFTIMILRLVIGLDKGWSVWCLNAWLPNIGLPVHVQAILRPDAMKHAAVIDMDNHVGHLTKPRENMEVFGLQTIIYIIFLIVCFCPMNSQKQIQLRRLYLWARMVMS